MTRLNRLGGIFVSPKATLGYVSTHPDLLLPCLTLLAWLVIPYAVTHAISGPRAVWILSAVIGVAISGIAFILLFVVKGSILWLLSKFFGGKARFYHLFCIIAYAHFPTFFRELTENAVKVVKPWFQFPTGLKALFPNLTLSNPTSHALVSTLLGRIEIFHLWSLSLTILGVYIVFKFRLWKATVVIFLWEMLSYAFLTCIELLKGVD
ncbi:hypothetical protein FJZ31_06590 [Candidatus Poribacteria bacterium]|nr:hypothetical protein [Candidatus Poribacteria bacterium]